MDRSRITERIVKLLRLAADQAGEPQGANALAHAQRLMAKYRIEVELVEDEEEAEPEPFVVAYDGPPGQFAIPTLYNVVGKIFEFDTMVQGNTLCTWVIWSGGRRSEIDEARRAAKMLVETFEIRVKRFVKEEDDEETRTALRMAAAGALEVWATRRFGLPMPKSQQEVPVDATITVSNDEVTAMVLYSEKLQAPRQERKEPVTHQLSVDMSNKRVVEIVDYFVRHQQGSSWLPFIVFQRACAFVTRKRETEDVGFW